MTAVLMQFYSFKLDTKYWIQAPTKEEDFTQIYEIFGTFGHSRTVTPHTHKLIKNFSQKQLLTFFYLCLLS